MEIDPSDIREATPLESARFNPNYERFIFPWGPCPQHLVDKVLWRIESKYYSVVVDPDAEIYGTSPVELQITWWEVKNWTKCGARLVEGRFVNLQANKRWAYKTIEEAFEGFLAKRSRQELLLSSRLQNCRVEAAIAVHLWRLWNQDAMNGGVLVDGGNRYVRESEGKFRVVVEERPKSYKRYRFDGAIMKDPFGPTTPTEADKGAAEGPKVP